jgi:hypothetical protein
MMIIIPGVRSHSRVSPDTLRTHTPPPPRTGHGRKGPKVAWTPGTRGAGGRTGSAPSPRAAFPRASRAYAGPGAVFGAQAP